MIYTLITARKFENFYLLAWNIPFFWFMFWSWSFHHSPSYIIWFYWTTSILHIQFGPFNNNFIVAWSNRKFWCCQRGPLFDLTRFGNAWTFNFTILTVAFIIFRLRLASIFVTGVTRTKKPVQSDLQDSKRYKSVLSMVKIASWTIAWLHFRSTSGFQKILLHQKIRHQISEGVFRAIFDLRLHLVVDILNFEPFVTRVKNMDATVNSVMVHKSLYKYK